MAEGLRVGVGVAAVAVPLDDAEAFATGGRAGALPLSPLVDVTLRLLVEGREVLPLASPR